MAGLARPNPPPRVFPEVDQIFLKPQVEALSGDALAAAKLLQTASQASSFTKRLLPILNNPSEQLSALLELYRRATSAESANQGPRASAYWDEAALQLEGLFSAPRQRFWRALHKQISTEGLEVLSTPEELRQRFVEEVLVDLHCAYFNGRLREGAAPPATDRVWLHVDIINLFVANEELDQTRLKLLTDALRNISLEAYESAEEWVACRRLLEQALERAPRREDLVERLAVVSLKAALEGLGSSESEYLNRREAEGLDRDISRLERWRRKYPDELALYEIMGRLSMVRAIKLGNAGELADALAVIERAVVLSPGSIEIQTARFQLLEAMTTLQEKMEEVQKQIRFQPRAQLNADGQRLLRQARRGYKPAKKFLDSRECRALSEGLKQAQGRHLWELMSQPPLPEDREQRAVRTAALREVFEAIAEAEPENRDAITEAWRSRVAEREELADLDEIRAIDFMEKRFLAGEDGEEIEEDGEASEASEAEEPMPEAAEGPWITPAAGERRSSTPLDLRLFGFWLCSWRNAYLKLQTAAAAAVLIWAAGLGFWNARAGAARDQAFARLLAASERGEEEQAEASARDYRDAKPLGARDLRDSQVKRLLQWAKNHPRREAHARAVAAARAGDDPAVMEAAATLLSRPCVGPSDGLDEKVIPLYEKAIVRWSAAFPKLTPEAEAPLARFRELVENRGR